MLSPRSSARKTHDQDRNSNRVAEHRDLSTQSLVVCVIAPEDSGRIMGGHNDYRLIDMASCIQCLEFQEIRVSSRHVAELDTQAGPVAKETDGQPRPLNLHAR